MIIKRDTEKFLQLTASEITMLKRRDCAKCFYSGAGQTSKSNTASLTCDYIGKTGVLRPCCLGECRDVGIFKPDVPRRAKFRMPSISTSKIY